MMKGKRGQVFMYYMMAAVVFVILALALAPAVQEVAETSLNSSTDTTLGLDCQNASISKYDKVNCTATDLIAPFYIGFLLFAAGVIIAVKLLL